MNDDSNPAPLSETMKRAGFLHEIHAGKELRSVGRPSAIKGNTALLGTVMRGGFLHDRVLHELRSKRPAVEPVGAVAARNSGVASKADGRHSGVSRGSTASDRRSLVSGEAVTRAGWLHKRAINGIWQRHGHQGWAP